MRIISFLIVCMFLTAITSIAKPKFNCKEVLGMSLSDLIKCNGKPAHIIQSSDKNFEFLYWGKGPWTEYVYDKLKKAVCSYGPVTKKKTIMDDPDCYPCGYTDC